MATDIQLVGLTAGPATGVRTSLTVSRTTVAGSLLVLYVLHQGNTSATVTDNTGGTWTLAGNTSTAGATSQRLGSIFYRLSAPSITSVTVTMATSSAMQVILEEYSGVASFSVAGVASKTADPRNAPPATVSGGDKLICNMIATFSAAATLQTAGYSTPYQLGTGTILQVTHRFPSGGTSDATPDWSSANSAGLVNAVFVGTQTTPPATPPIANAGPDQNNVEPWSTVVLPMSGTPGTSPITSYSLARTAGPAGPVITNGSTTSPSVYFPGTLADQTYTFTLTVSDGTLSAVDTMNVSLLACLETVFWNGAEVPCQWEVL